MRLAICAVLAICGFSLSVQAQQREAPAVSVSTVAAEQRPISKTLDLVGRVEAVNRVEIKNGILIVEFAKAKREQGMPLLEAATEGARLRIRPVMMTSFAFILGLLPLVLATGASELARRNVGTLVLGGMILASFVGIFVIPPLYVSSNTRKTPRALPRILSFPAAQW
jgi:Cu/Ag efflux pump CusA